MKEDYTYPIDYDMFNIDEVIIITKMFKLVEDINEGVKITENVKEHYKLYQNTINNKSIEKNMDKEFESVSGYSIFKTVKNYSV